MAVEPGDSEFKSKLDEASKKLAREELNELNEKDRELAVQTFRSWVLEQKWLKTPTEFEFLLRFLRARKFSQLGARATLENYWAIKSKCPKWFKDLDPCDKKIQEILRTGFYLVPRPRDRKTGRRLIINREGKLNLNDVKKKWGVENVFRTIVMVCDWLNRDENMQVNGLYVFIDNSDTSMSHFMTMWSADNGKTIMQFYQILSSNILLGSSFKDDSTEMMHGRIVQLNSLPARMKGLHFYNEMAIFDAAFLIFGPLMKQKSKDRMYLHGKNMANAYEHIDMACFPDEYLPDDYEGPSAGPVNKIIEDMIEDMTKPDFRDYIKRLSSDRYGVNLKMKPSEQQVPVASFRKLNVD